MRFYVVMAALTPRTNSSKISGCTLLILELKSDFREHWWGEENRKIKKIVCRSRVGPYFAFRNVQLTSRTIPY